MPNGADPTCQAIAEESPLADPEAVYRERRSQREIAEQRWARRFAIVSYLRLVVFISILALFWLAFKNRISYAWLIAPAILFIVLMIIHENVSRGRNRARSAVEYYRRGLDRLLDRWQAEGNDGSAFARPDHPYAADLDLFGRGSLFQLLCQARTQAGEQALADLLTIPVDPVRSAHRQEAVRDLASRLDFREDLALLSAETSASLDTERVAVWSLAPPILPSRAIRVVGFVLGGFALAAAGLWIGGVTRGLPFLGVALLQGIYRLALQRRFAEMVRRSDRAMPDFPLLAGLLRRIESETFAAPLLRELHSRFETEGKPPTSRLRGLRLLQDCFDARRNAFFWPFSFFTLWDVHFAFALESWRIRFGTEAPRWLSTTGELEALASLGTYAFENPEHVYPEFSSEGLLLEGLGMGHPLLPRAGCVRNDLTLDAGRRLYIISGSNMSGKSTWLRTVGTLCVLAYAGAPVRARALRLSSFALGASIRVMDSLQAGVSHFYAEIQGLRRIVDLARGERPVLFLIDEVLQGTNSHDRFIGTEAVLKTLLHRGAAGMISTHDLALTSMTETLGPAVRNVHFRDELRDRALYFDYRLHEGIIERSNALDLMRGVGLEV